MKKEYYGYGGLAIIVIAFILFFSGAFNSCGRDKSTKPSASVITNTKDIATADSLQRLVNNCYSISVNPKNLKEHIANLQKAYNHCMGILSVEERLIIIQDQLKNQKPKIVYITEGPRGRTSTKIPKSEPEDVNIRKFQGNFSPEPSKQSSSTTVETFGGDGGTLSTTLYEGGLEGDFCNTIDGTGHLVYGVKNSVFMAGKPTIPAPRLNGENGPEFTLDPSSGWWYYADGRLISVQEINNFQYASEWNIYIGQTNYGTGSYPTYLPHQMLKPLINKVRGKEWGEVTDNDLMKMRAENQNIWTPSSEGTLRPFRLDAENGRAVGKEDRNMYQGWNFRTRIFAKKKTTTTGSLIYKFPKVREMKSIYALTEKNSVRPETFQSEIFFWEDYNLVFQG